MQLRRLLGLFLALILASTAVAAGTCVFDYGYDYVCEDERSCNPPPPYTDCIDWCVSTGGTWYNQNEEDLSYCQEVCCCYAPNRNEPFSEEPIKERACLDLADAGEPYFPTTHIPGESCVITCGGAEPPAQGDPSVQNVSGVVMDTNINAPLADAKVWYLTGGQTRYDFTDATGQYFLQDVPTGTHTFRAEKVGCGWQDKTEEVNEREYIDFDLDCGSGGICDLPPVNDTVATAQRGRAAAEITWRAEPICEQNLQGYRIERVDSRGREVIGFVGKFEHRFLDTDVPTGERVCYNVWVLDSVRGPIPPRNLGSDHCVSPMSAYCVEHDVRDPQCFNNDPTLEPLWQGGPITGPYTGAAYCDDENRAIATDPCADREYCTEASGRPECVASSICEYCNMLYGFYFDEAEVVFGADAPCGLVPGCTLSNEEHPTNTMIACWEVESCYNYTTSESCTGNPCGTEECRWRPHPTLSELGYGICTPITDDGDCEKCRDVYGYCDVDLCAEMGSNCYWNRQVLPQETSNPDFEYECVREEMMACRFYDHEEDCLGIPPPQGNRPKYDVQYDTPDFLDSSRINGTNVQEWGSNDLLGFGKCAWVRYNASDPDSGGYCVKDANGRLAYIPDQDLVEDDCFEIAGEPTLDCFRDVRAPETIIPFENNSNVQFDEFKNAEVYARDDTYRNVDLTSRFCLTLEGERCYPTTPYDNLIPTRGENRYLLHYYSWDPSGNLEEVSDITLFIYEPSTAILINATLVYE